eukprot:gene2438-4728_t
MGNVEGRSGEKGGSSSLDEKWRCLPVGVFFNMDFLGKEYHALPLFDGTALPEKKKKLGMKLPQSANLANIDLVDIFCDNRAFPSSLNLIQLVETCLDRDVMSLSAELERRMRARAMLRLHLALVRQTDKMLKNADSRRSFVMESDTAVVTAGSPVRNSIRQLDPYSNISPQSQSQTQFPSSDLLYAISISASVAVIIGLRGTPMHLRAVESLCVSVLQVLSTAVMAAAPLHTAATGSQASRSSPALTVMKTWIPSLVPGSQSSPSPSPSPELVFDHNSYNGNKPSSPPSSSAAASSLFIGIVRGTDIAASAKSVTSMGSKFWGIHDSHNNNNNTSSSSSSSSNASDRAVYLGGGVQQGVTRGLRVGDIITVTCSVSEGWCDVSVNLGEATHRFEIESESGSGSALSSDYWIGAAIPVDCQLRILGCTPTALQHMASMERSAACCPQGHPMTRMRREVPEAYAQTHRSPTVRCDLCSRSGLEKDVLFFDHCKQCEFDRCFHCEIAAQSPDSLDSLSNDMVTVGETIPPVLVPGSAPLAALEQLVGVVRDALNDSIASENPTFPCLCLSFMYAVAVLRHSLPALLEVISILRSDPGGKLVVRTEADAFTEYLMGPGVSLEDSSWGDGHSQSLAIIRAVEQYSALGLFPLQDLTTVGSLLNIIHDFVLLLASWTARTAEEKGAEADENAIYHNYTFENSKLFCCCAFNIFTSNLAVLSLLLRKNDQIYRGRDSVGSESSFDAEQISSWLRFNLEAILAESDSSLRSDNDDGSGVIIGAVHFYSRAFDILVPTAKMQCDIICGLLQEVDQERETFGQRLLLVEILKAVEGAGAGTGATGISLLDGELTSGDSDSDDFMCLLLSLMDKTLKNELWEAFSTVSMSASYKKKDEKMDMDSPFQVPHRMRSISSESGSSESKLAFESKLDMSGEDLFQLSTTIDSHNLAAMRLGSTSMETNGNMEEKMDLSVSIDLDKSRSRSRLGSPDKYNRNPREAQRVMLAVSSQDNTGDKDTDDGSVRRSIGRVLELLVKRSLSRSAAMIFSEDSDVTAVESACSRLVRIVSFMLQSSTDVLNYVLQTCSASDGIPSKESQSSPGKASANRTMTINRKMDELIGASHLGALLASVFFALDLVVDEGRVAVLTPPVETVLIQVSTSTLLWDLGALLQVMMDLKEPALLAASAVNDAVRFSLWEQYYNTDPTHLGSIISSWDSVISNSMLEFSEGNTVAKRPGSRSCYPAAFARIISPRSRFAIKIETAGSTSNWLSVGMCRKGFPSSNSDGIGRTGRSWGIADDRSKGNEMALFAAEGVQKQLASRKLREGDVVTVSCNLNQGWIKIDVNGEFSHQFSDVFGSPDDFFMAVTFANDHVLRVLTSPSDIANRLGTPGKVDLLQAIDAISDYRALSNWDEILMQGVLDLRKRGLVHLLTRTPSDISEECLTWLSSPLLVGGLVRDSVRQMGEYIILRQLSDAPNGAGDNASKLVQLMRRFVLQDRGQDARANHAAHATCAALLWQHGLGGEAIALAAGQRKRPSEPFRRLWALAQKIRTFLSEGELVNARVQLCSPGGPMTPTARKMLPPNVGSKDKDSSRPNSPGGTFLRMFAYPGADAVVLDAASVGVIRRAQLLLKMTPVVKSTGFRGRSSSPRPGHGVGVGRGVGPFGDESVPVASLNRSTQSNPGTDNIGDQSPWNLKRVPSSGRDIHAETALRVPSTVGESVLNFIHLGPEPETVLKASKALKIAAISRAKGFRATEALLSSSASPLSYSSSSVIESRRGVRYQILKALREALCTHMPPSGENSFHYLTGLDGCPCDEQTLVTEAWKSLSNVIVHICWESLVMSANEEGMGFGKGEGESNAMNIEQFMRSHTSFSTASISPASSSDTVSVTMLSLSILSLDYRLADADLVAGIKLPKLLSLAMRKGSKEVRKAALLLLQMLAASYCVPNVDSRPPSVGTLSLPGEGGGRINNGRDDSSIPLPGTIPLYRVKSLGEFSSTASTVLDDTLSILAEHLADEAKLNCPGMNHPQSLVMSPCKDKILEDSLTPSLNQSQTPSQAQSQSQSPFRGTSPFGIARVKSGDFDTPTVLVAGTIVCSPSEPGFVLTTPPLSLSHSLGVWVWRRKGGGDGPFLVKFSHERAPRTPWSLMSIELEKGKVVLRIVDGEAGGMFQASSFEELEEDKWTHVGYSIDIRDTKTVSIYLNGAPHESKFLTAPLLNPEVTFTTVEKIIESSHPYQRSSEMYWLVDMPGASRYSIAFDSLTSMDSTNSFVRFYSGKNRTDIIGERKYTGKRDAVGDYPGQSGTPCLEITGPTFEVYFHTDSTVLDWGFKIIVTAFCPESKTTGPSSPSPHVWSKSRDAIFVGQAPSYVTLSRSASCAIYGLCCFQRPLHDRGMSRLPSVSLRATKSDSNDDNSDFQFNVHSEAKCEVWREFSSVSESPKMKTIFMDEFEASSDRIAFSVVYSEREEVEESTGLWVGFALRAATVKDKPVLFGSELGTWGLNTNRPTAASASSSLRGGIHASSPIIKSGDFITAILDAVVGRIEFYVHSPTGRMTYCQWVTIHAKQSVSAFVLGATLAAGHLLTIWNPVDFRSYVSSHRHIDESAVDEPVTTWKEFNSNRGVLKLADNDREISWSEEEKAASDESRVRVDEEGKKDNVDAVSKEAMRGTFPIHGSNMYLAVLITSVDDISTAANDHEPQEIRIGLKCKDDSSPSKIWGLNGPVGRHHQVVQRRQSSSSVATEDGEPEHWILCRHLRIGDWLSVSCDFSQGQGSGSGSGSVVVALNGGESHRRFTVEVGGDEGAQGSYRDYEFFLSFGEGVSLALLPDPQLPETEAAMTWQDSTCYSEFNDNEPPVASPFSSKREDAVSLLGAYSRTSQCLFVQQGIQGLYRLIGSTFSENMLQLPQIINLCFQSSSSVVRLAACKCLCTIIPLLPARELCSSWKMAGCAFPVEDVAVELLDAEPLSISENLTLEKRLFRGLLMMLGATINPFKSPKQLNIAISPIAFLESGQYSDILHALSAAHDPSWRQCMREEVKTLLAEGECCLMALEDNLQKERKNTASLDHAQILGSTSMQELLGLLALAGGFDTNLGPGSRMLHRGVHGSVAEEYVVLRCVEDGYFESCFQVCPTNGGSVESVFSPLLETERIPKTIPTVLSDTMREENKAVTSLLLRILATDTTDRRAVQWRSGEGRERVEMMLESPHPYKDNMDETYDISVPGATELIITFSAMSRTENNYDYLRFYKDSSRGAYWGQERYSGKMWPGVNGVEPLRIPASSCVVYFHSDGSNNDWGFKFTAIGDIFAEDSTSPRPLIPSLMLLRLAKSLGMDALLQLIRIPECSFIDSSEFMSTMWPAVVRDVVIPKLTSHQSHLSFSKCTPTRANDNDEMRLWQILCNAPFSSSSQRLVGVVEGNGEGEMQIGDKGNASTDAIYSDLLQRLSLKINSANISLETAPDHTLTSSSTSSYSVAGVSDNGGNGSSGYGNGNGSFLSLAVKSSLSLSGKPAMYLPIDDTQSSSSTSLDAGVRIRLHTNPPTTHCRIRALPTKNSSETGQISSGTVLEVTAVVDGFYRLADGRGYVLKDFEEGSRWDLEESKRERQRRGVDTSIAQSLFMESLETSLATKSYRVLCDIIEKRGVVALTSLSSAESFLTDNDSGNGITQGPGLSMLHLMLRLAGFGDVDSSAANGPSNSITREKSPLMKAFKSALRELGSERTKSTTATTISTTKTATSMLLSSGSGVDSQETKARIAARSDDTQLISALVTIVISLFREILRLAKTGAKGLIPDAPPPTIPDVVVESTHDYDNNANVMWRVHLPGATGIRIVFSDDSSTENNYDYVNIFAEEARINLLGGKFTGRRGSPDKVWPGVSGRVPLLLEGRNECWVNFISDGSNSDWGFKMTASAIVKSTAGHEDDDNGRSGSSSHRNISSDEKIEKFSNPSLNLALAVFQLILEFRGRQFPQLLSSAAGAELLGGLARCTSLLGTAHPTVTRAFVDAVTMTMHYVYLSRFGYAMSAPVTTTSSFVRRKITSDIGNDINNDDETCSDSDIPAISRLILIQLARRVIAMATQATSHVKLKGNSKDKDTLLSELFQAIVQAAVVADVAEIIPRYPDRYSLMSKAAFDLDAEQAKARGLQCCFCGRGVRQASSSSTGTRTVVGPNIGKAKAVGKTLITTFHLKIVSMDQGTGGGGISVGIMPAFAASSSDSSGAAAGSIFWQANGDITNGENPIAGGAFPKFQQGDVVNVSITTSDVLLQLSFSRNGVFIGDVLGPSGSCALIEGTLVLPYGFDNCWVLGVVLKDAGDEICLVNEDNLQMDLNDESIYPSSSSSSLSLSSSRTIISKPLSSEFITLSASGDVRGGASGREFLSNLLNEGQEPWNKWIHSNVSHSWVQMDFPNVPPDALCSTISTTMRQGHSDGGGDARGEGRSLRLLSYSLCSANDFPSRDPIAWAFMGRRADDGEWVVLHRVPDDLDDGNGNDNSPSSPSSSSSTVLFSLRWQWLHFPLPKEATTIELSAARLDIHRVRSPGDGVQLGHLKLFYCAHPTAAATVPSSSSSMMSITSDLIVDVSGGERTVSMDVDDTEIVRVWHVDISQPSLSFFNDNKSVLRPGGVSCYPAALFAISRRKCRLSVRLDEAPHFNNTLSFGIALEGFPSMGDSAFGEAGHSWGMYNNRSSTHEMSKVCAEGVSVGTFRALITGDVLSMDYDEASASATLRVNGDEYKHIFPIPVMRTSKFVMGATLCNDHVLTIVPSSMKPSQSSAHIHGRRMTSTASTIDTTTMNTINTGMDTDMSTIDWTLPKVLHPLAVVSDTLHALLDEGIPNHMVHTVLIPLCEKRAASQTFSLRLPVRPEKSFNIAGAIGYRVEVDDKSILPPSHYIVIKGENNRDVLGQQILPPTYMEFHHVDAQGGKGEWVPASEHVFRSAPRPGDVVVRARGWSKDDEDGGAGGLGDVVTARVASNSVTERVVEVVWRRGVVTTSKGPSMRGFYVWKVLAEGEVTVFQKGYNRRSPLVVVGSSLTITIRHKGSDNEPFVEDKVKKLYCRVSPILEYKFERHLCHRRLSVSRLQLSTSHVDVCLMRHIEATMKTRGWDKQKVFSSSWADIAPHPDDMDKHPLFQKVIQEEDGREFTADRICFEEARANRRREERKDNHNHNNTNNTTSDTTGRERERDRGGGQVSTLAPDHNDNHTTTTTATGIGGSGSGSGSGVGVLEVDSFSSQSGSALGSRLPSESPVLSTRFALIKQLNQELVSSLSLIDLTADMDMSVIMIDPEDSTATVTTSVSTPATATVWERWGLGQSLFKARGYILQSLKYPIVEAALAASETQTNGSAAASTKFELTLSRSRAAARIAKGECGMSVASLRRTGQLWSVVFAGERFVAWQLTMQAVHTGNPGVDVNVSPVAETFPQCRGTSGFS